MSDLHQLLTEAVPPVEPGFDETDVRARVARVERRHRRIVASAAVLVVVVLTGLVATGLRGDQPTDLVDDVVPVSQWPDSVDFVGVEIAVEVWEEPTEPLEYRVGMGSGTAALTTPPSDLLEPGNTRWQRFQHRLWFSCGGGRVVRMVEAGRAEGAPEFTVAGPSGRWLPAGALIEAGRRLAESIGCEPAAPAGAPEVVEDAQPWVGELAGAMEQAGLTTCCANPGSGPRSDWYLNDWGVLLDGDDRLSLSVAKVGRGAYVDEPVEVVEMAGGQAWQRIDPSSPADVVELVCGDAHILAYPTSGRATSVERFVERIGCTPEVPAAARTDGPTPDPTGAASVEAAAFMDRIRAAGLAVSAVVSDAQATTFHARPTAPTASPVWISVDTEARWDVNGTTPLISVCAGEVAEIGGGLLGMS